MRIAFALAALLFVSSPTPAQTVSVPFRGGSLSASFLLPIDWQGKPAFLLFTPGPTSRFLRFDYVAPNAKPFPIPSFRVAAGYFEDRRSCAPGSRVHIADDYVAVPLGDIRGDGTLNWTPPSMWNGPVILRSSGSRLTPAGFWAYYCNDMSCGNCKAGPDGPQLAALVLVLE